MSVPSSQSNKTLHFPQQGIRTDPLPKSAGKLQFCCPWESRRSILHFHSVLKIIMNYPKTVKSDYGEHCDQIFSSYFCSSAYLISFLSLRISPLPMQETHKQCLRQVLQGCRGAFLRKDASYGCHLLFSVLGIEKAVCDC